VNVNVSNASNYDNVEMKSNASEKKLDTFNANSNITPNYKDYASSQKLNNQSQSNLSQQGNFNTFNNINPDFMQLDANNASLSQINETKNDIINTKLQNIDNKSKDFIKSMLESEFFKVKQFVHDEIQSLHVDLIRQFEIQQVNKIKLYRLKYAKI